MAEEEVKVLSSWASPYSIRVLYALELKGIAYENVEEDLLNKSQLLLESNPVYKKIPVLIHNCKPICESAVIVQYIDEAWPRLTALLPKDPYSKAIARFWGDFVDKKILVVAMSFARAKETDKQEAANKEFIESCLVFETELSKKQGPFFGGDKPGFVDVIFAPCVVWLPGLAELGLAVPAEDKCPRLHKLMTVTMEEHAAEKSIPDLARFKAFVHGVLVKFLRS